jgi:hypothetical protein
MIFLYEMYYKEFYNDRLAQAAAERAIKQALENNQTAAWKPPRNIINTLQKYRLKFVGIYQNLYQRSKSPVA